MASAHYIFFGSSITLIICSRVFESKTLAECDAIAFTDSALLFGMMDPIGDTVGRAKCVIFSSFPALAMKPDFECRAAQTNSEGQALGAPDRIALYETPKGAIVQAPCVLASSLFTYLLVKYPQRCTWNTHLSLSLSSTTQGYFLP